ncbi:DNA internalization-related competence protein ComEC/Rec2 [Sinimarinibacterium sp. CAU 1509]|uniref:DNA internalization-related competence protein ComEC/Rec2 n=1 Tax=Sinimarinibacterium sp. CAU 1509 TaxID=2562283 RepID=UPI0010AC6EF9|nr:DNA internalization-related competence protein ComEC/Rec2 [Sinimarinibacterium sp. CAU 1509]TJY56610.1 DNA internalization-related competence protein ComEC/Rec2 [Sinimarinibacterium sp. CAU 1509]
MWDSIQRVLKPRAAVDPLHMVPGFTVGVLCVHALPELPTLLLLCIAAVSTLLPWRGRALWGALVLGLLLTTWQAQRYLDQRWPARRHGETVELRGVISSLPERRQHADEELPTWRFLFTPDAGAVGNDFPRRIRVSWYRSEAEPSGAQCWVLRLRMRSPHGSLNPGGFDYEAWLLREGIGATASVVEGRPCTEVHRDVVLSLRQSVVDRVHAVLGRGTPAALILALSVGDTSDLRDADWDRYRLTGTTHLIAISGFNLAIVGGFAFLLLRWTWSLWPRLCLVVPAQRVGLVGSAMVATVYALLAGFEPPVTRALIMLLVLVAASLLARRSRPLRSLGYAWALILMLDPMAVLSPGLWLSFGAVTAIFYVTLGRWRAMPAWRTVLVVQLFLSLMLMPLTVYFFGGLAWLSPLANLMAVPVFTVLTPVVLIATLLAMGSTTVGPLSLQLSAWALDRVDVALQWAAQIAPQAWIPAGADVATLALACIGAILAFAPRGLPLRHLALIGLLPLAWPQTQEVERLQLTVLDVGQGLAVVVRTANHTLLFDAGPAWDEGFDAGRSVVVPYLLQQGVRRIDRLLLSHGDNDHAGGVAAVRSLLDVGDEIGTDQGRPCLEGEAWTWDGVQFELLHPDGGAWSDNNGSCVLHIDGVFDVLLPGDIEHGAEKQLLRAHPQQLHADVLIAPHHGSRTSSTRAFVAAVQPQWVVFPAGWRSRYGHPKPEVVARYRERGAVLFTTGVEGAITITMGPDGEPVAEAWRRQHRHWWNTAAEP